MGKPLILLLLAFWAVLAYRAAQGGDMTMAFVYVAIGVALTIYRLRGSKPTGS